MVQLRQVWIERLGPVDVRAGKLERIAAVGG